MLAEPGRADRIPVGHHGTEPLVVMKRTTQEFTPAKILQVCVPGE